MVQVTARLPDTLGAELDAAAQQLNRCRADIIRQAIEYYRVVYEWQRSELMILVVRVGHRLEVYR
ncbi:MAG: type II toxin-antitoxin system RelE/ParE family toxin [Cyanobium sp. MAG_04]|jgi:predicted transcriptional regulator|nr:type II toxin-antitoxin system RelE/ParE family toxin [Cyanobium sp. MAG_04]